MGKKKFVEIEKMEWRRFDLIDPTKEDKLLKLLYRKNLSREDLILIFQTLRANDNFFKCLKAEAVKEKMDLTKVSTKELVKELESRKGIEKISVGLYAPYELKEKYIRRKSEDGTRGHINADTVLVISSSD